MLGRKIIGNLTQVRIGQVRDHVGHDRVLAPAVAEVHQLVVEVAGRFAGNAREVFGAVRRVGARMAGRAGKQALRHGVGQHGRTFGSTQRCGQW
jgi:hypothetical protein